MVRLKMRTKLFIALMAIGFCNVSFAEKIKFECPAYITADQKVISTFGMFTANNTKGVHLLESGRVAKYEEPYPEHKDRAALVYRTTGVMGEPVVDNSKTFVEKFDVKSENLADERYQFFCNYRETAVSYSVPLKSTYNECLVTTVNADPKSAKEKAVYMVCDNQG
jgi:hypothetical protein